MESSVTSMFHQVGNWDGVTREKEILGWVEYHPSNNDDN